jgi:hypothetical protein
LCIEQDGDDVGLVRSRPGAGHHCAIEPTPGNEDARRIDKDKLRPILNADSAQEHARRLHLVGDGSYFAADQRIEQRRFARIRRSEDADKAATGFWRMRDYQSSL